MKQLTKHDVNRLTAKELRSRLPFEIVSDGKVIAAVIPVCDVNKLAYEQTQGQKPAHDVNKLELPLSKKRQAEGRLSSIGGNYATNSDNINTHTPGAL